MVNGRTRLLSLLALLWLFALPGVLAAQVSVTAKVEPTSGSLNDSYTFSITIEGSGAGQAYPTLVGGDDFKLTLIGPQRSVRIVNGVAHEQATYVYRLVPTKTGSLESPVAEVEINGTRHKTAPIRVEVKAGQPPRIDTSKPIFLRQGVTKTEIYRGEQIVNTIDLYSRVPVVRAQIESLDYPGFLQEPIGEETKGEVHIGGETYVRNRIRRALYPLNTGELQLPARVITGELKAQRRGRSSIFDPMDPFDPNFFNDFFGRSIEPFRVQSNTVSLEVKELPPAPASFPDAGLATPIVGELKLEARFASDPVRVGEGKTVVVEINSTGNLSGLKTLPLASPASLKIYQEPPRSEQYEEAGKLWTKQSYRISVVPLRGGHISIAPIAIGFFDPEMKQYQVAKTREIALDVTGEALSGDQQSHPETAPGQEIEAAPPAHPPVARYTEPTLLERLSRQVSISLALLALALSAVLVTAAILAWKGLLSFSGGPITAAAKSVSRAGSAAELRQALLEFLSLRLLGVHRETDRATLRAELRRIPRGSETVQFEFDTLFDDLDNLLFAPDARKQQEFESIKNKAERLVRDLM